MGDQFITALGPGSSFGEMALISEFKRTTDETAATYYDVFKLSKTQFNELIARHADLKANVLRMGAEKQAKLRSYINPSSSKGRES
jgi:CRP-like cAMP-binding protein